MLESPYVDSYGGFTSLAVFGSGLVDFGLLSGLEVREVKIDDRGVAAMKIRGTALENSLRSSAKRRHFPSNPSDLSRNLKL